MNIIQKRITALEGKVFVDTDELPEGIFCYVADMSKDAPPPAPVGGWLYNEHRILRAENETDEKLTERAIKYARPFLARGAVPVFRSINE